jgi:ketosteroid isomerase-like protein
MKKFIIGCILCVLNVYSVQAQQEELNVKATINQLFEGMRNADSTKILSAFAPAAIMQTIVENNEGKTSIRQNQVAGFAASVGKLAKGAADEQIVFETIKVDGDLAIAWTPYRFIFNGNFSHCGVNTFTLVKLDGVWKINYIIDTRRKENCN